MATNGTTVPSTSLDDNTPLFTPSLISPTVSSQLPEGYHVRPLRRSDYNVGFLDVLRVLTTVGDITPAQWIDRYTFMASRNDTYYLLVVTDASDRVVGTGALIVERKFIHRLGMVGHIEDIAVAKDQQGKKLGLRIIQALDFVAERVGCYKVSCPIPFSWNGMLTRDRLFWIARRRMRGSTSSAGLRGQVWRWLIITTSRRRAMYEALRLNCDPDGKELRSSVAYRVYSNGSGNIDSRMEEKR